MGKELKSSYELAMERLRRKDAEQGEAAPAALTAKQRREISAIRKEYKAKLAEREIEFRMEQQAAAGDPERLQQVADSYRRDREFLEARQEARLAEVRGGKD